jgi:ferredoxin
MDKIHHQPIPCVFVIHKNKTMTISKVWIVEGCISCGLCSEICPDVFELEDVAVVRDGADYNANANQVVESAESCPVEVIKYE